MPFSQCISNFERISAKNCKIKPSDFLLFLLAFTSADTTFHKNLENVEWKGKNYKNLVNYKKMADTSFIFAVYNYSLFPQKHSVVFL